MSCESCGGSRIFGHFLDLIGVTLRATTQYSSSDNVSSEYDQTLVRLGRLNHMIQIWHLFPLNFLDLCILVL